MWIYCYNVFVRVKCWKMHGHPVMLETCLIQYTNKSNLYDKVGMINQYLDNIKSIIRDA